MNSVKTLIVFLGSWRMSNCACAAALTEQDIRKINNLGYIPPDKHIFIKSLQPQGPKGRAGKKNTTDKIKPIHNYSVCWDKVITELSGPITKHTESIVIKHLESWEQTLSDQHPSIHHIPAQGPLSSCWQKSDKALRNCVVCSLCP